MFWLLTRRGFVKRQGLGVWRSRRARREASGRTVGGAEGWARPGLVGRVIGRRESDGAQRGRAFPLLALCRRHHATQHTAGWGWGWAGLGPADESSRRRVDGRREGRAQLGPRSRRWSVRTPLWLDCLFCLANSSSARQPEPRASRSFRRPSWRQRSLRRRRAAEMPQAVAAEAAGARSRGCHARCPRLWLHDRPPRRWASLPLPPTDVLSRSLRRIALSLSLPLPARRIPPTKRPSTLSHRLSLTQSLVACATPPKPAALLCPARIQQHPGSAGSSHAPGILIADTCIPRRRQANHPWPTCAGSARSSAPSQPSARSHSFLLKAVPACRPPSFADLLAAWA
ncbi:hypothetical protein B0J12DRAFT_433891 [Macrophomina phaseolina]|uniref:Uncharacterized protein n=1 Tax=Macrophomina phaseolina TaxID=35725 RepID=A0ABQ8GKB0_9PEZI|nr:hypothetical protein B0J12DRAFT_433891 [Macrophomina phaseolina]